MASAFTPATDAPRSRSEIAQFWLAAALAAAATSPGLLLMGVSEDPNAIPNPIFRWVWLPVYAGTLLLAAWRAPRLLKAWAPALLCGALVAWAWASQQWSILPDVTHRRVTALFFTTLLGLVLGAVFDGRRLVELLAAGSLVVALGSAVVSLADPAIGVMTLDGGRDWRGLYAHKNELASIMAIGSLAAICAAIAGPRRRWLWLTTAAVCFVVLLLSRGKTSLVGAGLVSAGAVFLIILRRGPASATIGVTEAAWLAWVCIASETPRERAMAATRPTPSTTSGWSQCCGRPISALVARRMSRMLSTSMTDMRNASRRGHGMLATSPPETTTSRTDGVRRR